MPFPEPPKKTFPAPPLTSVPQVATPINEPRPTKEGPWWNPIEVPQIPDVSADRPDTSVYGGHENIFEDLRYKMIDNIATGVKIPGTDINVQLPESLKPIAAAIGSTTLEIPRFITDVFSQPDAVAAGAASLFRKPPTPKYLDRPGLKEAPTVNFHPAPNVTHEIPKVYPPVMPVQPAKDTLLANALRMYDDPNKLETAIQQNLQRPVSGYQRYLQNDAAIQGEVAAKEAAAKARFERFMAPSSTTNIPAQPYSKAMGFEASAQAGTLPEGPDALLYQTIPQRLWPRRSQSSLEALVPNSLKVEAPKATEQLGPGIEAPKVKVPKKAKNLFAKGKKAKPAPVDPDPLKLKAVTKPLAEGGTVSTTSKIPYKNGKLVAKSTGLGEEGLAAAANSSIPEIKQAATKLVESTTRGPRWFKRIYTDLESLGESGKELSRRAMREIHLRRQYDAKWSRPYINLRNSLSKAERENFGAYVEGRLPIPNDKVKKAVEVWRSAENVAGDEATKAGLRVYHSDKKWKPFAKHPEPYWPHIPAEKLNPDGLLGKLKAEGMSTAEAQRVVAHYRKTGEIVIGAQHVRRGAQSLKYRDDFDAGIAHLRSMAKRISQHREFGPEDVSGFGSEGIADLINATTDHKLANKLMERILGRDESADEALSKALNVARKYSALTKLQNFTIPNVILGQTTNALKASRHPIVALKSAFNKGFRNEVAASGAWEDFAMTVADEMSGFDPFLIKAGETINRGIAATVGKGMARAFFKDLKANPGNKLARKELYDLVLEDVDTLLKQAKLTPEQEKMAMGRMAEMTQGLNVPGNLPFEWSSPVKGPATFTFQMALQFKKMAYQNTKAIWESIKRDPARNIPLWFGLTQVAGAAIGGTKSALKGAWKGDIGKEWEERDDWVANLIGKDNLRSFQRKTGANPEVITRMLDFWSQAFVLGLPADMLTSATYKPSGLAEAVIGPVAVDVSKTAYNIATGKGKNLAKDAIKSIPIPGSSGLAEELTEKK